MYNHLLTKTAKRPAITPIGKAISFALFSLLFLTAINTNVRGQADNFNPNVTGSSVTYIQTIVRQPDGKILIGGSFTTAGGQPRRNLARVNADGTLDTTFTSPLGISDSVIYAIVLQTDGKILVAAGFNDNPGQPVTPIIRLNSDGTRDTSFNLPQFNGAIYSMLVQADGKILIGGLFTIIGTGPSAVLRRYIARLNSDGSVDANFNPTLNLNSQDTRGGGGGGVHHIIRQPDGKIIIGGFFFFFEGVSNFYRYNIARMTTNGTFDSFDPGQSNGGFDAVTLQPDGKILIGGGFSSIGTTQVRRIARLNADSTIDNSFNAMFAEVVNNVGVATIALQTDGKILVGGQFNQIGGQSRNTIARLNPNGTADNFNPSGTYGGIVNSIVVQPDGKILVGGSFNLMGGQPRNNIARLNPNNARFDFDGDGKSDVSVFRPSNGAWYLNQSSAGFTGIGFGISTDKTVPADYDGDGRTDVAVFRNGIWYLLRSQLGFTDIQFGAAGDVPAPADYDGDGKADLAVFRPSNGVWYLQQSTAGFAGVQFGQNGDKPVAADYDGDGKADLAIYRSDIWYILRSQLGVFGIGFGAAEDKPAPADYDGDGKTDVAVFRPSNGTWYLQQSTAGFTGVQFGATGDVPSAADFDGDGKADIAVFRNGIWYLNRTTAGFVGIAFGTAGDKPAPNAFVP